MSKRYTIQRTYEPTPGIYLWDVLDDRAETGVAARFRSLEEAEDFITEEESCDDCSKAPGTSHYVGGAKRCAPCAATFDQANRDRRAAAEARRREEHVCGDGVNTFECCCQHEEHKNYVCNDCGAELDPGGDIDNAMQALSDRPDYGGHRE